MAHQPRPKFSEPRSLTFFPFGPSIQLLHISITSGDSSLNVALIPASASTSPSDWGSTATFTFLIRLRMLANRPSMLRVMLEEAGVEVDEDISVKQPRLSSSLLSNLG